MSGDMTLALALGLGLPAALMLVGILLLARAYPREPSEPEQLDPTDQTYRHALLALRPPHDGALLGYRHPLGHPVRIVQGIPVAVGRGTAASRWSAAAVAWVPCEPELAAEARERLRLEALEETRADDSLPVAQPVSCVRYTVVSGDEA